MRVLYADEMFLLNVLVDYLLLLSSARLAGEVLYRGRMGLSALLGGVYAVLCVLPSFRFLAHPLCRLASGVLLCLIAYGSSRHLMRVSLVFAGASAAFGGGVLALQLLAGGAVPMDLKTVLLSASACYLFLTLIFQRTARHTGGELAEAELYLKGRHCRMVALVDTGNTLTDPVTGRPVMVAEADRVSPLFPAGQGPDCDALTDPVGALSHRREDGYHWRLIPYRAVGIPHGLLLAVRVDRAVVNGEDYGPILVALSPGPLTDGGGYHALIGA